MDEITNHIPPVVPTLSHTFQAWFVILIQSLPAIFIAVVVLAIAVFLARVGRKWVNHVIETRTRMRPSLIANFLGKLTQWIVLLFGIFLAVMILNPHFQFKDLINTLGVSGIVIGFAFKDILQNFIAGILLMLNEPFQIGETIEIGKDGYQGVVIDIKARATVLQEKDSLNRIIVPNSEIFTKSVRVMPLKNH